MISILVKWKQGRVVAVTGNEGAVKWSRGSNEDMEAVSGRSWWVAISA